MVLVVTTGLAMAVAPWLVALYAPDFTPDQLALATAFAYWCLPQIFFYGVFALLGEILNARRVFGPYTWAPIVNNLVSITGFALFIVLFGPGADAGRGLDARDDRAARGNRDARASSSRPSSCSSSGAAPACTCAPTSAGAASASTSSAGSPAGRSSW